MNQYIGNSVGFFIPTLNAEKNIDRIISSIEQSCVPVENLYVIDSESTDGTVCKLEQYKVQYDVMERRKFSHVSVRHKAFDFFKNSMNYIIMATQDVIFSHEAINLLVEGIFKNQEAGVSYGRQISTKPDTVEYYDKLFNYPEKSKLKSKKMISDLGADTFFSSDAFSIYRISALKAVDDFPQQISFAEDAYVAAKLILADWEVYYNADSIVIHNNISGYISLFKRYREISNFYRTQKWIKDAFGANYDKGRKLVIFELQQAARRHSVKLFIDVLMTSTIKLIAYKLPSRCVF